MKTFYTLLLALVLGMTFTGQAYAAQNGGMVGRQGGGSGDVTGGYGVGDMIQQQDRDQDCDYAGDCDGDQDRLQQRDRDQDCDNAADCDQTQVQQRDRDHVQDPDYTRTQYYAQNLDRMQQLMEQLREALGRMYSWRW